MPEPKSVLLATAEANKLAAVASAKSVYNQLMEEICGGTQPYLGEGHLAAEHLRIRDKAIYQFTSKRKLGGEEFCQAYLNKLEENLEEQYNSFKAQNESKNIFKAARTPAVYLTVAIFFYILSGVFGLFGIYAFANFSNLLMGIALLTLTLWAYIRYSGNLRDIGGSIDEMADLTWEKLLKPIYKGCMEKGIQQVSIQVAENALGPTTTSSTHSRKSNSMQQNGKVRKRS